MGVEADFAPVFKTLVNDLKTLGRLPFGKFCDRLHNKAKYNQVARGLFKSWDQSDRANHWLRLLTVFSVAEAVDHVDDSIDPHRYKYWIFQDHVKVRYGEVMTKLLGLCLGEHINAHLKSLNNPTLQDLSKLERTSDTGAKIAFHQYMRTRLEDHDFIDGEIMVDQNNKDHLFSISLLFAADYLVFEPGQFPAYGNDYANSPSYQILEHWSTLPVIGVVLVVVEVILAIVSLLIHLFSHEDPPEDPVQTYIDNTGKPVIAQFGDAPDPQLVYSVSPTEPSSGDVVSITVEAQNNTGNEVTLASLTITVLSGGTEPCLFSDKTKIELVGDDDPSKADAGHIYVMPNQYVNGNLPLRTVLEDISPTYHQYDLQVGGLKKEKESALHPLILGAFERFRAVFTATVNSKGHSKIDVVEKKGNDRSHAQLMLTRV